MTGQQAEPNAEPNLERSSGGGPGGAVGVRAVLAVLVRPDLWWTAVRTTLRLAPPGWWRRAPYLPLPSPAYLRFRMVTAYGGDGSAPARPHDLVAYLEWCRAWPAVTHRS